MPKLKYRQERIFSPAAGASSSFSSLAVFLFIMKVLDLSHFAYIGQYCTGHYYEADPLQAVYSYHIYYQSNHKMPKSAVVDPQFTAQTPLVVQETGTIY